MDAFTQFLTTTNFWLQVVVVFVVVVPLGAMIAVVWLRVVDISGSLWLRIVAWVKNARVKTVNTGDERN
ncbi:hypothetical protein N7326_08300 [Corynebacterium sp. ES2794-CONJ1]|uniref:hypothetical protein n=1 Tax=unclassified Corynebacterium TaxID=2624378 RepID=UPI00216A4A4F|nr:MULTISPECIES: hypothetical protein [unclassified Corynebacterium]MCS4490562.1 hypothetical protein [Corynebacterium sp. ES2775-CONJ]MCS4492341.1 hypothetical protein [Corynebacterium sp. ES2715-CONJ3]MCS4532467.1 hypothetical protein [Corynebacterium sp. ES2730-CONJ]MCU9519862.1 hypothetical protein [Corynebacterium sp. ES2794-CONJ1]